MTSHRPLPITVLTGFLGAGKTTLLRSVLSNPGGQRLGVLVNDFGEINIDAALIIEGTDDAVSLSNGCVCCTIQTELITAVRDLIAARPDLDRILIEASGVSRSLALADTLASDELRGTAALDGMFCLVDAASFPELDFASTELAIDQITGADMIILTKTDLVSGSDQKNLEKKLSGLMPHLRIVPAVKGEVPLDLLFGPVRVGRAVPLAEPADAALHAHNHHPNCECGDHDSHTDVFASWSWRSYNALDKTRLLPALRRLGAGLLRAKGVLQVQSAGGGIETFEFQQVGKRSRLSRSDTPSATAESLLVGIGLSTQIDPAALTSIMNGSTAPAET